MSLTSYPDAPFGIQELGGTYLTELAQEIQQIQADPLGSFLPQRAIVDEQIRVEWVEGELRLLGVVNPGMPNGLNTFPTGKRLNMQPALFRRGQVIDQYTLNHLRAPGETQKLYGMELVQEQMTGLIEQGNMMLTVLRAQLLTGGINYVDRETGVSVQADSGIPAGNLYTIGATAPVAGSVPWSDIANSTPVTDLQHLVFRCELEGRNKPTHIGMNGALLFLLSLNHQIQQYLPNRTDSTSLTATGVVQFGEDGLPTRIAGLQIVKVNTVYDDYDANMVLQRRYMWPLNKVTLFAPTHPSLPSQILGRTILTKGEHPRGFEGETGVWVETYDQKAMGTPTSAPGVGMKVGMAGLPVLMKPKWVHIVTVGTVADIENATSDKYSSRS